MLRKLFALVENPEHRNGLWHLYDPMWPRRTLDGGWTAQTGTTWRRWRNDRWEYRHEPETPEEWADRQW